MHITDAPHNRLVMFDLTSQGLLTYRAGRDAVAGEAGRESGTWRGACTADDLKPVIDLLEANPGFDANSDPNAPRTPVFRVQVSSGGLGLPRSVTSDGPTPFLTSLWRALDALQRRKRPDAFDPR